MYLPKRDTMHLRNKTVLWALACFLLLASVFSWARTQQNQGTPAAAQGSVQPTPLPSDIDPSDPALPVWARPATPAPSARATPNTPPSATTGNVPPNQPQPEQTGTIGQVTKGPNGSFTLITRVQNVTLPVTVMDDKHHLVTNLQKTDFVVYEDGQPQQILECRREDIPVSIGILVDNSGSMREKRAAITKAVVNLVRASNPSDEVFVVNFNDEPYMDQDFTNNVNLMHEALDRLDSRGGTALYDAVIASADHLAKAAKREKKVLLVVTDGEDNESRESLEQAIRSVQDENGPTIYTIGILGSEGKQRRAKRALEALSLQTGGVAFFPKNLEEVDEISQQVAHDIRNQYNIVYKPNSPKEGYHSLKVVARASGKDLQVRTKSGYFSGQQQVSK
ncbi:MAG: VWA domain-containing protein [Candidatus Angelobacter sp. Gp1-AA117]|nr:MAG: VWA domain-containing protein [Candidatus Angelobacter sp. Gp1-AA117]